MGSSGTPSRAKLAPRLTIPARDAMISFVFDDGRSDDPVLDFGDRWCAWDGGPPAPAEVLETTGVDANARTRVTIALAPNATHLAIARGRRLAVVATQPVSGKSQDGNVRDVAEVRDAPNARRTSRTCVAEVRDASGPDPEAYVTSLCWLAFAEVHSRAVGAAVNRAGSRTRVEAVADLSVAVGTSDGRLLVYAVDGTLLISKRFAGANASTSDRDARRATTKRHTPVRSLRARDCRRSPSKDEVSEDLVAALDAYAVRIDALELRSALRRAHLLRRATQSQARFRASAEILVREDASDAILATTKWDLSRFAPVADCVAVGRLPPSVARAGFARADDASTRRDRTAGSIGGVSARSRGVGVLCAGLGDPRGDSGVVCLLASYDDDKEQLLDHAAALARKTATVAAATVSSLFGGAVSLAGAVTKNLPVGRALGGAVVNVVEKAGNAAGSNLAEALSLPPTGRRGGGDGKLAGDAGDAGFRRDDDGIASGFAKPLTWRSAWIDPPRRTRRFAPAPRGPLVAAADSLGRVTVLDVAAPATLAVARVIKGCRDAEMAWVENLPPRGTNARLVAAAGGLGALFLAVRSPHRNGGAVELWRCGGGAAGGSGCRATIERGDPNDEPETRSRSGAIVETSGTTTSVPSRLLQAATPFGAADATSSPSAAVALAVAASKCFLLTPDGLLREVMAP